MQQPCLLPLCLIQLCCLPFNIPIIFFLFYKKTYLSIFGRTRSSWLRAGLLWLRCVGSSLWGLPLLRSTGHRHGGFSNCALWLSCCSAQALERCCGPGASLLHSTWDVSSTRDPTAVPGIARQILSPWTTWEAPVFSFPLTMLPGVWDLSFPDQGLDLRRLHWELGVLTNVPPEKSYLSFFFSW